MKGSPRQNIKHEEKVNLEVKIETFFGVAFLEELCEALTPERLAQVLHNFRSDRREIKLLLFVGLERGAKKKKLLHNTFIWQKVIQRVKRYFAAVLELGLAAGDLCGRGCSIASVFWLTVCFMCGCGEEGRSARKERIVKAESKHRVQLVNLVGQSMVQGQDLLVRFAKLLKLNL